MILRRILLKSSGELSCSFIARAHCSRVTSSGRFAFPGAGFQRVFARDRGFTESPRPHWLVVTGVLVLGVELVVAGAVTLVRCDPSDSGAVLLSCPGTAMSTEAVDIRGVSPFSAEVAVLLA